MEKKRCFWCDTKSPLYVEYHDNEWGVPSYDDHYLFEMLILEGMQAGLSWLTVLKKRDNFRKAFDNFDFHLISKYDEDKINSLLQDAGIIRNKLKVNAVVRNAKAFIEIQKEFGSFSDYIWSYVDHKPIKNTISKREEVIVETDISRAISKDLRKRGMNFVGPTIIYAYMQAVGMVDDHETYCFRH